MKRICILFAIIAVSCSKGFTDYEEVQPLSDALESSIDALASDAFSSIVIDNNTTEEVSRMIASSLQNGFDECFYLREMFAPEVKVSISGGASSLKEKLENYFESNSEFDVEKIIDILAQSNLIIYWPYSDMWDGETLPTISFMPENIEQEWNFGYKKSFDSEGGVVTEEVIVDDDYAVNNPVWIIKEGEYDYDSLPNFNAGEYQKNGVFFNAPETKSSSDTIHVWRMTEAQVTKQYDTVFQGSSNLEISITYPILTGMVNDYTVLHTAFTRSEIRKKKWKSVNLMLNTDWIPAELSNGMFVVETDGGDTVTESIGTKFVDPDTGLESNWNTSVSYKDNDDIIGRMVYKRSYVFSSLGASMQSFDDGGFNFYFTIDEYIE